MLAYRKDFGLHQLNVLGLAEAQKMITRGFYTTATNFSTDRFGYDNLQAGAVRLWRGPVLTMRLLIWLLSLDV